MQPTDILIPLIILAIVGGAVAYIIKAKKSGKACIGCPYADTCCKGGHACSCSHAPSESAQQASCSCCSCEQNKDRADEASE